MIYFSLASCLNSAIYFSLVSCHHYAIGFRVPVEARSTSRDEVDSKFDTGLARVGQSEVSVFFKLPHLLQ